MRQTNPWLIIAGIGGFTGVVLGAVGAHAAPDAAAAALIEKASFYQLIHSLALLAVSTWNGRALAVARLAWVAGIVLFCGSLYAKALTGNALSVPLAPLGGTCFMAGWLLLIKGGWQAERHS